MKIESIKQQSSNKYNLIIDSKKHVIYDDVLLAYNVYNTREISKDIYDKMINMNNFYDGYYKIIHFIDYKMRSEKEVKQKLKLLKIDNENSLKIINKLKEQGYLDEQKYIKAFINDSINLTLKGPRKIILELQKRGIDESLVKNELDVMPSDIWLLRAQKVVDKRLKNISNASSGKIKLKLKQDLYNLGYFDYQFMDIIESLQIDDSQAYKKQEAKIRENLAKKYSGEKLEYMIKQKLYALGYRH